MKMSLLHALAALLTVLMVVVRQRHALAATCSNSIKHWKPATMASRTLASMPSAPSRRMTHCCQQTSFYDRPKYKRDPEINIDNEEIGQCPRED